MKSSAKIFYGLTVFLAVMAVLYILATMKIADAGSIRGLEWAGATGLVLATGLTLMPRRRRGAWAWVAAAA